MKKIVLVFLGIVVSIFSLLTFPPSSIQADNSPIGWLDVAEAGLIAGWAYDPDAEENPISVSIFIDNTPGYGDGGFSVSVLADQYRSDLCSILGSCNHGFSWTPPQTLELGSHIIRVYGVDPTTGGNHQLSGSPKYLIKSGVILGISISADYKGKILGRDNTYDGYPSIMLEDGNYKMWYCGAWPGYLGDQILYTTSTDGLHWTNPVRVFGKNNWHTCDPSVVKVNGIYYLYTTQAGIDGLNGQIYLATSTNGLNWVEANGGNPVIPVPRADNSYGIGQSSVLYKDGQFIHYFTDTITSSSGSAVYIAYSQDGIHWTRGNNNQPVHYYNFGDVKYSSALGKFIMISHKRDISPHLFFSDDGITWSSSNSFRLSESLDENRTYAHNPGLLGNPRGIIEGMATIAYWTAGLDDRRDDGQWNNSPTCVNSWDIDAAEIRFRVATLFLSSGWNQITWPDVSGKKASDTPPECPIAVSKENFWFKPYVRNFGGVNFSFEKGKTYFIKCNQVVTWQL